MRALALLAAAGLSLASAAEPEGKRRELEGVREQISETRRQIEEFRRLEQSLNSSLKEMDTHRAKAARRLDEISRGMRQAQERQSRLRSRLGTLRAASGSWRRSLASDLDLYARRAASDDHGTLGLWAEAIHRGAISRRAAALARLQGLGQTTEAEEAEARRKAADLLGKSRKAREEAERKRREYDKQKAAVLDAQEKKTLAEKKARELEETARALTRLIKELERRDRAPAAMEPWTVGRNSLPWPADGRVMETFGRHEDPDLKTKVIRQGMRLAVAPGAAVSAVSPGKVIFAGPFRSYGRVVILDHGGGFYSIYGGLGDILSAKGRRVGGGEVIARAGDGRLYLELRRGSEALDPLLWLQKK